MSPPAALGTITGIIFLLILMMLAPKFLGWILVLIFGVVFFGLFAYLLFQALTGKNLIDYLKETLK